VEAPRGADVRPLPQKLSIDIENLNAVILAIAHVNAPLSIEHDRVRQIEFARRRSLLSPFEQILSIFIELDDPRIAVAVGNKDVAVGGESDIRRAIEIVVS